MGFDFNAPDVKAAFQYVTELSRQRLDQYPDHSFHSQLATQLLTVMGLFYAPQDVANLNRLTHYSRQHDSFNLAEQLRYLQHVKAVDYDTQALEYAAAVSYLFLREIFFRYNRDIDMESNEFIRFIRTNRSLFASDVSYIFDFGQELPYRLCHQLFNSSQAKAFQELMKAEDIKTLEEFFYNSNEILTKLEEWEHGLNERESRVRHLLDTLSQHEASLHYNGMSNGFTGLIEQKKAELRQLRIRYVGLTLLLLALPMFGAVMIYQKLGFIDWSIISLFFIPIGIVILAIFYFLHLHWRDIRTAKLQLLELEHRLALCQFIQSYSEASADLRNHDKEGLDRFENLMFSPIMVRDK